jgi:hypothetical protein
MPADRGAASLLQAAGLEPRGPVAWATGGGAPRPGVYVIELPLVIHEAPIDRRSVAAWLARVPTLRVDDAPPTVEELIERLATFWVADDRVVYVGMTNRSVRGRLRAYYRTPLGDSKPHAGGHWIQTLAGLGQVLVWWAESDRPLEAEAGLLEAFAQRQSSATRDRLGRQVAPFANRRGLSGPKAHGISGSTIDPVRSMSARPPVEHEVGRRGPGSDPARRAGLAAINAALRVMACRDGEVSAVAANAELAGRGLLPDSDRRPGLPLRRLLRDGLIENAVQESNGRWFIRCRG